MAKTTVNGLVIPDFDQTLDTNPKEDWDLLVTALTAFATAVDSTGALVDPHSATFSGAITEQATTDTSSETTGAIICAGGVGIAKKLYVKSIITCAATTASSSPTTGALIIGGGAGIAGALNAGGVIKTTDSTAATTVATGSLIAAGGMGVAGAAYVGGLLNVAGVTTLANATEATSATAAGTVVTGGIGLGKMLFLGASSGVQTAAGIGAANTGTTAVEYGLSKHHVTVLTVNTTLGAIVGGASLGLGKLIYTMPAGAVALWGATMSVAITQTQGHINADTPDVGLGVVVASGANALLSDCPAGSETILTGQTASNCTGTATVKTMVTTPIAMEAGAAHTVYLNVADGWAASGDAGALLVGTVVLDWSLLA